jgi:(p)ppGpp synthase/HD superfamily hydrolase
MKNIVKLALKIATKAHKGQFRHDGKTPYITHPIAVAEKFKGAIPKILALLHDVLEDSSLSKDDLLKLGIHPIMCHYVNVLTKKTGQSYLDYLLNIKNEYWVTKVKIEDIKHNLSTLEPKKKTQRDKYLLALYILEH